MSDTRTYIVPDGQENSTNQMLPWMAMMNGGMGGFGGNGMWNNPFMYLVWMWMMRWMNRVNGETETTVKNYSLLKFKDSQPVYVSR